MPEPRVRVGVVGGSGYVGGELLRLLVRHPGVELAAVTSRRFVGKPVARVHPNLRGATGLRFLEPEALPSCDVLFTALPHGALMDAVDLYLGRAEYWIDLSADFRLEDPQNYERWYGRTHPRPDLLEEFVYGLPEVFREQIQKAHRVAAPGCTATAAILALWPLVRRFEIERVVVDAKVGSSAAGAEPDRASHHPERAGVVRCFKPTGHRHLAEMHQVLGPGLPEARLDFTVHAVELVRGILATCHVFLAPAQEVTEKDVWQAYLAAYRKAPFIRLVKERAGLYRLPEPKLVMGTNFCELGFERDARTGRLVVLAAMDNLTKGAAGQAVQCLNLMLGLDERTGLDGLGLHPV